MVAARIFFPAMALVAMTLQGQAPPVADVNQPAIAGIVRDAAGAPVSDVEVAVMNGARLGQFVITATDGRFLLTGVAPSVVPVRIRRLGYAMQFLNVDPRDPSSSKLEIVLKTVPGELEEVTIPAVEGRLHQFYEHKAQRASFGTFLDQNDVRRLGPTNPSDLFRTVPGVVISTGLGGNQIRIRGCQPMVWVDGQRVVGAELDEVIHPSEIAAIEFYPSNAGGPPQYLERGNRLCGLILVWTRTQ